MASKNDFTPEEWTKVLESIMVAGIAVSAADPSGLWGTLKEAAASSSALAAAKRDPKSNELIKAAIADFETSEGRSNIQNAMRKRFAQAEPAECVQRSLASLRRQGPERGGIQGLATRYQPEGCRGRRGGFIPLLRRRSSKRYRDSDAPRQLQGTRHGILNRAGYPNFCASCRAEVPGIHDFARAEDSIVDGRDKPGHD